MRPASLRRPPSRLAWMKRAASFRSSICPREPGLSIHERASGVSGRAPIPASWKPAFFGKRRGAGGVQGSLAPGLGLPTGSMGHDSTRFGMHEAEAAGHGVTTELCCLVDLLSRALDPGVPGFRRGSMAPRCNRPRESLAKRGTPRAGVRARNHRSVARAVKG